MVLHGTLNDSLRIPLYRWPLHSWDREAERVALARPSLEIGKHRIPLDLSSLIVGLVLAFFSSQIAPYLQASPAIVMLLASIFLLFGLHFLIYGRIGLRINA